MVYVYAIQNEEKEYNNKILSLMSILSLQKKSMIKKYIHQKNQEQCILGESLLRYILWKHYGVLLNEISYTYNNYGKPSLVEPKEIYFNISHSGDWVVCGTSDTSIGVDVEMEVVDYMAIAKRYFLQEEYEYIISQLPCNQKDTFCKIWTLKESYIKCVGKGLVIPLDSFEFKFTNNEISMYMDGVRDINYIYSNDKVDDKYYISICILGKNNNIWNKNINIISIDELLTWRNKYFNE